MLLRICSDLSDLSLKLSNLEIRFTRRNYENITEKANVLTTMLANPKIAPVLAFTHCGLFSDPQLAYRMSMEYMEEQQKKAAEVIANGGKTESGGAADAGEDNGDRTGTEPTQQNRDRRKEQ